MSIKQTFRIWNCIVLLGVLWLQDVAAGSRVDTLKVAQVGQEVVMEYAVVGASYQGTGVLMEYRLDGGSRWKKPKGLKENINGGIKNGRHLLTWEVLQEFPEGIQQRIDIRVVTRDEDAPEIETDMVSIRGGCFQMGSPSHETGRDDDENQHKVCVEGFRLGKKEVTKGAFGKFVNATGHRTDAENNVKKSGCFGLKGGKYDYYSGRNWRDPGFRQNNEHPVVCVSYRDTMAYIDWLNRQGHGKYRLPTEAEWEYAARAGTTTARFWGDKANQACGYANVADRDSKKVINWSAFHECNDGYVYTAPVGQFDTNNWGLYDMQGNVHEWLCSDWNSSYSGQENRCSSKANTEGSRSLRGGSWGSEPTRVRSANRNRYDTWLRIHYVGFRLAQDL